MTIAARYSRNASMALGAAVVWSLLLVVAAFVAPVYSTSSGSASPDATGGTTSSVVAGTATLVGVNGYGVLLVVAVPLLATLVVAWALARGRRRLGWVVTSAFGFLTFLALMSIGVFFVPVTVALIVACAGTPRHRVAQPADPASLVA